MTRHSEEMYQAVEETINKAGIGAQMVADAAITDYAFYYTMHVKDQADSAEAAHRFGHFQGETDALSWMLGYQTETSYSDMNSVLFDYIQERGRELARKNLAVFAA